MFKQPSPNVLSPGADKLTSREPLIGGYFLKDERGKRQGVSVAGRVELSFGKEQTFQLAFKDVNPEGGTL